MQEEDMKTKALKPSIPPALHTYCTGKERREPKRVGKILDKQCLVMINTGASVTTARPDITAGLPNS
jgi:hypothetical protein